MALAEHLQIHVQVVYPEHGCPCGRSSLVRRDTGLCEKCTAVLPEELRKRQEWRELCFEKSKRRSAGLPPDVCMTCMQSFGEGVSRHAHERFCPAKPYACSCGVRYYLPHELRSHQSKSGRDHF